jgi:hypothetical protein
MYNYCMLKNPELVESITPDQALHPGMSPERAAREEFDRKELTLISAESVCRNLKDYIEYAPLNFRRRMEYEFAIDHSPEKFLFGSLEKLFTRAMAGHGNEMQAINILQAGDVILEQESERTGDAYFPSSNDPPTEPSVTLKDDGVEVVFKNMKFFPKDAESSEEPQGLYTVKIKLTRNIENIDSTLGMVQVLHKKLREEKAG